MTFIFLPVNHTVGMRMLWVHRHIIIPTEKRREVGVKGMLQLQEYELNGMKIASCDKGKGIFEGNDRLHFKGLWQASKGSELFRLQTPMDNLGFFVSLWM